MEMNGGFLVTKIKQLGDRIFEKILSEKNIDAFNGAQGRILYVLWQEDGISIRSLSTKCGLAITSLTTMLERIRPWAPLNASIFFSQRIFSKIRSPSCFILVTRNPPFISIQNLLYSSFSKTYYIGALLSTVYMS